MPRVAFDRDGLKIEADLSFDELKELIGINGHRPTGVNTQAKGDIPPPEVSRPRKRPTLKRAGNFPAFMDSLGERAAKFIFILRRNAKGIEIRELAPQLGFEPQQIGGLTGPAISKVAKRYGITVSQIYRSKIEFVDGQRKRIFYPGTLTMSLPDEGGTAGASSAPKKIAAETAKAKEFLDHNGAAFRLEIIEKTGISRGSFGHFVGRRTDLFRQRPDGKYEVVV